jgi:hypothetical protein
MAPNFWANRIPHHDPGTRVRRRNPGCSSLVDGHGAPGKAAPVENCPVRPAAIQFGSIGREPSIDPLGCHPRPGSDQACDRRRHPDLRRARAGIAPCQGCGIMIVSAGPSRDAKPMISHRSRVALAGTVIASALVLPGSSSAQTSATTPREFIGIWAVDCSSPDLRLASNALRYRGDRTVSAITQVVRQGPELRLHYTRALDSMAVVDTLRVEGDSLRLIKTVAGGAEASWTKQPWKRCPVS